MVPTKSVNAKDKSLAVRRKVRRNGEDLRSDKRWQEILTGAAVTFRRIGYANATLEDVAVEVGINRASLYYYVATKAELLIEILQKPILEMTKHLAAIEKSSIAPKEKLREAISAHMRALDESYPELFIFLSEQLHLQTIGKEGGDVVANARLYGDIFTRIIEQGQSANEIRIEVHPRIAMMGIVGMCNWTHRWYHETGSLTLKEIGEDFTTLAMNGLLVTRSKRRK
jgi:AcrR family transcriptional regulator